MGLMKEFWDNEDGIGVVEIVLIYCRFDCVDRNFQG